MLFSRRIALWKNTRAIYKHTINPMISTILFTYFPFIKGSVKIEKNKIRRTFADFAILGLRPEKVCLGLAIKAWFFSFLLFLYEIYTGHVLSLSYTIAVIGLVVYFGESTVHRIDFLWFLFEPSYFFISSLILFVHSPGSVHLYTHLPRYGSLRIYIITCPLPRVDCLFRSSSFQTLRTVNRAPEYIDLIYFSSRRIGIFGKTLRHGLPSSEESLSLLLPGLTYSSFIT